MIRKGRLWKAAATLALVTLATGCGGTRQAAPPEIVSPAPAAGQPVSSPAVAPAQPAPPSLPSQQSGGISPAVPATPQPKSLPFTTLARGYYSGVADRQAVLITDEARLKAQGLAAPSGQPRVDFADEAVLAIYMGEQRTGGYSVEIRDVRLEGDQLIVTVLQTRPGPGAIVTQALTQPFHAVRIPRPPEGTKVVVNWQ